MNEGSSKRQLVRFGPFEVNLQSGELRKSGVKVRIQEQPFRVLRLLLECPGEVVTRDQLAGEIVVRRHLRRDRAGPERGG